jgi:hypothetical protein
MRGIENAVIVEIQLGGGIELEEFGEFGEFGAEFGE